MTYSYKSRRGLILNTKLLPLLLFAVSMLVGVLSVSSQAREKTPLANPDKLWSSRVEPLLDKYCLKCHAGVRQQGGLDLRSIETILRGGEHGSAIIPGKPNESRVVQYVLPNSTPHMPPDNRRQLSNEDISVLKAWIAQLPVPKSNLASNTSKDIRWVPEYLAEYRRSHKTNKVPPAYLSTGATIDWFLQVEWQKDKIEPAPLCGDAAFVRRIYLDIVGRIPSREELKLFLAEPYRDKRQRLISKLIESEEYPRHMREVFDTVLMGRPTEDSARQRVERGWNAFLEDSFRMNRPWNETVHDMLLARSTDEARRGAVWFLAEKNNSHQAMAEAVAPVVFGVQIKCAQCHNHPLVWEIEQRHYWGLVATFNRSKNIDTEVGLGVAESAIGGFINFANLKKESQPAVLVFLNGKNVPEKIPAANEKEVDRPELYLVPPVNSGQKAKSAPVPKFSRREAFAESVTRENPLLARAFVNRMWAALMGRGIVHPADQIDSRHRPSHPELLEWLANDFEQNGYNIKRLVQGIVSSRAYQLGSKSNDKTPPRAESFARGIEKPLSAEQLLHSMIVATENRLDSKSVVPLERAFAMVFPDVMPETYNPSLQQALFLSNSPIVSSLLKPAPGNTTTKIMALKSNAERVREAFLTVFGRIPDATELQQCQAMLNTQSPEKGTRNLLWALLTSTEFQVNH